MSSIYGFNAIPIMLQLNKKAKDIKKKLEKQTHFSTKKAYIQIPISKSN